jgi:hypothetical protein
MAEQVQLSHSKRRPGSRGAELERRKARQHKFLAAYKDAGTVTHAAESIGMDRRTHYDWLKTDPDYAVSYQNAEDAAIDALESEARRRALVGIEEPVFHQGREVGLTRKYSDALLIFLLKAKRPNTYRERVQVQAEGVGLLALATPDQLRRLSTTDLEALEGMMGRLKDAENGS